MEENLGQVIKGILMPIVGVIGIIGNLVSIHVLRLKELSMNQNFCHLLILLATYDSVFLALHLAFISGQEGSIEY